jgi:4-amino-4-deoxy-L-arabinose transferase-like glycosyltransferase
VAALAILTALIAICLSFHRLGANSIFGDEAIAANVAHLASGSDEWYPLENENGRYVSKPPLSVWPMALRFKIAGPSELNARIDSAIAGVLASMLLFALGTWLVGARAGALAAILLISSRPWLLEHGVREGVGDIWMTLLTGVALLLYVRGRMTESRRLLIAAAVAATIGALIKGPVVFLILAGVGLLWEAAAKLLFGRRARWGVLCLVVLASAIPLALWFGDNALNDAVSRARMWAQFAGRHTQAIDSTHLQGIGFYPRVVARAFGVWLVALLFPMLWRWLRTSETAILLPLWALFPIATFSLSVSKLPWYIDPAFPPLALLIAIAIVLGIEGIPSRPARSALGAIVVGLLALRVLAAWNAINATPRRIDMHRLLIAYRSADRPVLYVDTLGSPGFGYREWNNYYLNLAKSESRPIPTTIDRARCSAVVTMHPEPLLRRADFAGAKVHQVHKYDPREVNLYVLDLCGGHFARALGGG